MFNPGDEVICVDDRPYPPWKSATFSAWLVRGKKYTIRDVIGVEPPSGLNVRVHEITASEAPAGGEFSLKAERFRKVQKTDIGVFEKFKQPIPVLEDA